MRVEHLGLVALALAGTSGVAWAQADEEVLRELRALRERVEELEAREAAREAQDGVARAVEEYLATRDVEGPVGGLVVAPRSQRIELGGMVRVRGEMQRRSPTPPDRDGRRTNELVLGRARLHADARIASDLRAFVELQDARIWGEEPGTVSDTGGVDLSQGYVDFERVWDDTRVRVGRQAVSYSDQRFIGALEWSNPGRRFDGVTATHARGDATYDVFAYRLADGFAAGDPGDNDVGLVGGWAVFPGVETLGTVEAFALLLNSSVQTPSEVQPGLAPRDGLTQFWTLGSRVHGKDADRGIDWDFQGAVQTGDVGGDDLSAWALRGEIGIEMGRGRLGFEADYATGEKRLDDGQRDQFQVLFPTNHGYYGIHDLAAWSNLHAWSVNYRIPLATDVTFETAYWRFKLDEEAGGWISASGAPVRAGAPGAGRSLGHELDMIVTWKQSDRVTWQLGWAHFWAGRFVRSTEPDGQPGDSDFFYLQTLVTF